MKDRAGGGRSRFGGGDRHDEALPTVAGLSMRSLLRGVQVAATGRLRGTDGGAADLARAVARTKLPRTSIGRGGERYSRSVPSAFRIARKSLIESFAPLAVGGFDASSSATRAKVAGSSRASVWKSRADALRPIDRNLPARTEPFEQTPRVAHWVTIRAHHVEPDALSRA